MKIMLKSAYAPYDSKDGTRYLVETFWPEGVDSYFLSPYEWVHELAPSYEITEMALWKHWTQNEFRDQYKKELQEPERRSWFDRIVKEARRGPVTLLQHSKKKGWQIRPEDTTAYYLREFLESHSISHDRDSDANESQSFDQWSNEGGRS